MLDLFPTTLAHPGVSVDCTLSIKSTRVQLQQSLGLFLYCVYFKLDMYRYSRERLSKAFINLLVPIPFDKFNDWVVCKSCQHRSFKSKDERSAFFYLGKERKRECVSTSGCGARRLNPITCYSICSWVTLQLTCTRDWWMLYHSTRRTAYSKFNEASFSGFMAFAMRASIHLFITLPPLWTYSRQ